MIQPGACFLKGTITLRAQKAILRCLLLVLKAEQENSKLIKQVGLSTCGLKTMPMSYIDFDFNL